MMEALQQLSSRLPSGSIAYVSEAYPGVMTFMEREIDALVQLGWSVIVYSLGKSGHLRYAVETEASAIRVEYCLNSDLLSLGMLKAHLRLSLTRSRKYFGALLFIIRAAATSLYSFSRLAYSFLKAVFIFESARKLGIQHVHAHFAGRTTEVSLFLARFLGVGYSFTGHSNDVISNYPLLFEKLEQASFTVAISERARQAMAERMTTPDRVYLIRTGLDLNFFQPNAALQEQYPTIVSIGRIVESKGFEDLIEACDILRWKGERFQCRIVGKGPAEQFIKQKVSDLHLTDYVTFEGELVSTQVLNQLQKAWIYTLACKRVQGGKQDHDSRYVPFVEDGIPVSLIEAMAVELPVVTTSVGAICELVEHRETGLIVDEQNPIALAEALEALLRDSALRTKIGVAARLRVAAEFDNLRCAKKLSDLIRLEICCSNLLL